MDQAYTKGFIIGPYSSLRGYNTYKCSNNMPLNNQ